jgi:hypothetical protein
VSADKQARWEAEIVAQFGETADAAIRDAKARVERFSTAQMLDFKAEINAIHASIVVLIEAGGTPSSKATQDLIGRHYRWVCRSWRPEADAYAALGRMYVEHADFRLMYDGLHPGMAVFLQQAMACYARNVLRGPGQ